MDHRLPAVQPPVRERRDRAPWIGYNVLDWFMRDMTTKGLIVMADPNRPRHYEEEFKRQIVQSQRERQAVVADQGGVRHPAFHAAALGAGHPQQRLHESGRQPHSRGERADRIAETQQAAGDGGRRFRTSGAGIRTKAGVIRSNAGRCPISAQCGILGIAKSACYWMPEHPETERADPYEKDVERVWRDSGKVYGARRIRHALGHEGVTLSRRRVNRIMKGNGMAGSYSKAAYRPHPARPNDDPAPNILAREFNGYAPRTHLASDPAYVRVAVPRGRTSACPATWPTGRSPAIPWESGTTPTSCWPRSPRRTSP